MKRTPDPTHEELVLANYLQYRKYHLAIIGLSTRMRAGLLPDITGRQYSRALILERLRACLAGEIDGLTWKDKMTAESVLKEFERAQNGGVQCLPL